MLLIFSLHGADWDGLLPWLNQETMPTLASLRAKGRSGNLLAELPSFVNPNWASFWTGVNPGLHGIFAFSDIQKNDLSARVDRQSIGYPTWMEILSKHRIKTCSLYAPLTNPTPSLHGSVVSSSIQNELVSYPISLSKELMHRFDPLMIPKPDQYFPASGLPDPYGVKHFVELQMKSVLQTRDMALHLMKQQHYDVVLIHVHAIDSLFHALWHGVDRSHPSFDATLYPIIGSFLSSLDRLFKDIIDAIEPSRLLVFSEHGFMSCNKILNIAPALIQEGILNPANDSHTSLFYMASTHAEESFPVYIDHKALYVPHPKMANKDTYDVLIYALEHICDPTTNIRIIKKAWCAHELYGVDVSGKWNVIVLEINRGYTTRCGDTKGPVFQTSIPYNDYMVGTHTSNGLWLYAGREASADESSHISILNLAPSILHHFGITAPPWMQGKVFL